jgi:hypothetical protein
MYLLHTNYSGGCLYVTEATSNKEAKNTARYVIQGSNFTNCTSYQSGGAIYLDSVQGVVINGSSKFEKNSY